MAHKINLILFFPYSRDPFIVSEILIFKHYQKKKKKYLVNLSVIKFAIENK